LPTTTGADFSSLALGAKRPASALQNFQDIAKLKLIHPEKSLTYQIDQKSSTEAKTILKGAMYSGMTTVSYFNHRNTVNRQAKKPDGGRHAAEFAKNRS